MARLGKLVKNPQKGREKTQPVIWLFGVSEVRAAGDLNLVIKPVPKIDPKDQLLPAGITAMVGPFRSERERRTKLDQLNWEAKRINIKWWDDKAVPWWSYPSMQGVFLRDHKATD